MIPFNRDNGFDVRRFRGTLHFIVFFLSLSIPCFESQFPLSPQLRLHWFETVHVSNLIYYFETYMRYVKYSLLVFVCSSFASYTIEKICGMSPLFHLQMIQSIICHFMRNKSHETITVRVSDSFRSTPTTCQCSVNRSKHLSRILLTLKFYYY